MNDAAIVVLAATAGACAPPLGVVMRTLWSTLIDDPAFLQTAFSLDGVAEELLNVTGPVIAGVILVVAAPAVGLLVSAGLAVTGTGLFLRSPALRRWPAPKAGPAAGAAAPADAGAGRAIAAIAFATGAIGLYLGGLGLVIVAFSQARHDLAAVAWIEAGLSAGSALGGLGYGAVAWRASAQRRLVLLVAGLTVVLVPAALSPDLPLLALLVGLAGVLVSPALSTAYVLAASLASPQARNRAGNWANSGYNAGSSAGTVVSGQLIGRIPLSACLPVLIGAARRRSGEQRPVGASQTGSSLNLAFREPPIDVPRPLSEVRGPHSRAIPIKVRQNTRSSSRRRSPSGRSRLQHDHMAGLLLNRNGAPSNQAAAAS